MSNFFKLVGDLHSKKLVLDVPNQEIRIIIDNDDVYLPHLVPLLERLLTILNDNWYDPKYTKFCYEDGPDTSDEAINAEHKAAEARLLELLKGNNP